VRRALLLVSVASLLTACRPDPGPSHYDQQEPFPKDGGMAASLPGPYPYQPGTRRLSIGAFYESGYSDVIAIDNMSVNLYVYENTLTLLPEADHIEGTMANRITHAGMTWWGFGVHWMVPRDMSTWTHLHVSLKSSDATFATVDVGMNNANPVFLHAPDYGYAADGEWHSLSIPVADFVKAGLDVTQVAAPFVLTGGAGMGGETLKLDDVYFSAE
jgi:hypothetical protein